MNVGSKAVSLIKTFEGCKLKAYTDGGGVLTIGFGHTGPDVTRGLTITQDRAEELLRDDLAKVASHLNRLIEVPLTQNQFDALCVFVFNIGVTAFSGSHMLKLIEAGQMNMAQQEFALWTHDNGRVIPGLVRRRSAERCLFVSK